VAEPESVVYVRSRAPAVADALTLTATVACVPAPFGKGAASAVTPLPPKVTERLGPSRVVPLIVTTLPDVPRRSAAAATIVIVGGPDSVVNVSVSATPPPRDAVTPAPPFATAWTRPVAFTVAFGSEFELHADVAARSATEPSLDVVCAASWTSPPGGA